MKQKLILLILVLFTVAEVKGQIASNKYYDISNVHPSDTLFRIYTGERYELGVPSGYVNQKGDTIIPIGKHFYCFLDTVITYAIVADTGKFNSGAYVIDQKGNRLYEVYWFDNGPDIVEEGLFRIKRNGKIGFANTKGEIVIRPQFECAHQFKNGKAKVTYDCDLVKEDEHTSMKSNSWFYIDKTGQRVTF